MFLRQEALPNTRAGLTRLTGGVGLPGALSTAEAMRMRCTVPKLKFAYAPRLLPPFQSRVLRCRAATFCLWVLVLS